MSLTLPTINVLNRRKAATPHDDERISVYFDVVQYLFGRVARQNHLFDAACSIAHAFTHAAEHALSTLLLNFFDFCFVHLGHCHDGFRGHGYDVRQRQRNAQRVAEIGGEIGRPD